MTQKKTPPQALGETPADERDAAEARRTQDTQAAVERRDGPAQGGDTLDVSEQVRAMTESLVDAGPVDRRPADGEGNYEVRLRHAPSLRVRADGPAHAWEQYKVAMGLYRDPDHRPEVIEITE